ncbi:MAG: hypothetical protein HOW73_29180 [Polyangiaceae bacterium]|nr:hypothetical protein [Polyangiaceae bacterium]
MKGLLRWVPAAVIVASVVVGGCDERGDTPDSSDPQSVPSAGAAEAHDTFDPTEKARRNLGIVKNLEASVPPACYTKTGSASNPCWVCHTVAVSPYGRDDRDLQSSYDFSPLSRTNRWNNLFEDRRAAAGAVSDEKVLRYVREDNYSTLRSSLESLSDYPGYTPDLDLAGGFDDAGFALDGSGWRAVRYLPFPGTFWPTNGSADDVFIRLPDAFRRNDAGELDTAVYRLNLAILEAAIASRPSRDDGSLDRAVEPVDERLAGADLDADGRIDGTITTIRLLPRTFAGRARAVLVERYVFPEGTELLHSVRYLDPDAPTGAARRMKELRYMRKVERLDRWAALRAIEEEAEEKAEGRAPVYRGDARVGLRNAFGWQLQGFIEDERGRLRLQTDEEHRACMGCHGSLGVTIDSTFSFARKVPGKGGYRMQDLRGMPDVPEDGHEEGEVLTYLRRVGAADEMRHNDEMRARFFPDGVLAAREVARAAPGGDRDLAALLVPTRGRALALDKAYWALVREQRFELGRDTVLAPPENVHRIAPDEPAAESTYGDGRLTPAW